MANKSTLIGRRNYGMKIAMPGYDCRTAGDNELLFNSSFPILQIKILASLGTNSDNPRDVDFGGEYLGEQFGMHVHRWYHGLKYPPFFILLDKKYAQSSSEYVVDENFIYTFKYNPRKSGEKVLLCPIDITRDIEYPYTAKPLVVDDYIRDHIGHYGFKTVHHGDIMKNDFNNWGINVRLQSQMVLAIKNDSTVVDKPSEPNKRMDIEYVLPRGMSINDCMVYAMAKTQMFPTDIVGWKHIDQYAQSPPSIFIDQAKNMARLATLSNIPAAMIVTRLPMVAAHRTESSI